MILRVKSKEEILERLRDLIHRHRKRYIKARTKPKGNNCTHKQWDEEKQEWFCAGCGTRDPGVCLNPSQFHPEYGVEELKQQFRDDLCNTQKLLRDYRDLAALMWSLGAFDDPEEYEKSGKGILEERTINPTLKEK